MTRAGWIAISFVLAGASVASAGGHHHAKPKGKPAIPDDDPLPPEPQPAPEPPPPPASDDDSPWSRGVSAAQKATAQALLEQGNDLFVQNQYKDALAKYQDAVASWDHPAIRFNMVRALIALDRPLDAYDNLQKALAYGKDPLEDQVYAEALNYQILLEGQIATLSVQCKQDGVQISIDGEAFLSCPGAKSERILPGSHAVVGKKDGYMTSTQDVTMLPGKTAPIDVQLESIQQATRTRTRWATWKPWAVAGGGLVFGGLGVLVDLQASSDMNAYESEVATQCAEKGCPAGMAPLGESRALLENRVAIGIMAVGGAVVAAGVTMVILNRPQTYIPEATVTPIVGAGGGGVMLSGHF
jgi:hypothetical protein